MLKEEDNGIHLKDDFIRVYDYFIYLKHPHVLDGTITHLAFSSDLAN